MKEREEDYEAFTMKTALLMEKRRKPGPLLLFSVALFEKGES